VAVLPGVNPASVELNVERNVLTVSAQRPAAAAEGEELLVSERPHGTVSRQLFLGEGLVLDRIEARYDRGVLTVSVPVAEAAKPREVEITAPGTAKAIEAPANAS
jgi:HSP20 family protein